MEEEGVACSHGKEYREKEALWACAQVYHVRKTAEAATAMTKLVRFETRSSAQDGPMAFRKQSRSPEEIFLLALENE